MRKRWLLVLFGVMTVVGAGCGYGEQMNSDTEGKSSLGQEVGGAPISPAQVSLPALAG